MLRGGEPGMEQGQLPATTRASVLGAWHLFPPPSLPQHQVDPRPPQGVQVVACVMLSPGELAAAFPLLTQSQPACWAF